MKNESIVFSKKILFVASCFLTTGIFASCGNQDYIVVSQKEMTMMKSQSIELASIFATSYSHDSLTFVYNSQVISIENDLLTAIGEGDTTLSIEHGKKTASMSIHVDPFKPVISYNKSSFDLDIAESNEFKLKDYFTVTPNEASFEVSSAATGWSYNENIITFDGAEVGTFVFTLKAKYDNAYSDEITFSINTYNSIKLKGTGTPDNPFIIGSAEDLKKLSNSVLDYKDLKGKYFKQTADISLKQYENWTPIGTFGIPFEGIYDGDGHKVTDIKIDSIESWQGLFGFSSGIIKNLTVYGDVKSHCNPDYVYSHSFVAGLCGGLYNAALIDNCVNYCTVEGDAYVGGICGGIARSDEQIVYRDQSYITNCENYGKIIGVDTYAYNENAQYFGGICGESLGILLNNTNYGEVDCTGTKTQYVGGVCGLGYIIYKYGMYMDEDLEIYASNNNVNYGHVKGYHSVGGVFGSICVPSHNCINYGKVEGDVCVGGVCGLSGTNSVYSNNYSIANISDYVNEGEVIGHDRYVGGVVSCSYFEVKDCINKGTVTGDEDTYYVGGVVGYESAGNVINCVNEEGSDVTGYYGLGGVVGWSNKRNSYIETCFNYANVSCYKENDLNAVHIGGIVGMLGSSNQCRQCTNYGNVYGKGTRTQFDEEIEIRWGGTAGIAGSIYSGSMVLDCVNRGNVEGYEQVGGLVGFGSCNGGSSIQRCIVGSGVVVKSTSQTPYLGCLVGRMNAGYVLNNINYGCYSVPEGAKTTTYAYLVGSNNGAGCDNIDLHGQEEE